MSFGGAFDANLQAQTLGVLLMSAGEASGALVDTFLRDLPRLSKRGQSAFVQLMKTGRLNDPRRDAITFVSGVMHEVTDAKQLLEQIESASAAYVKEAQGLEKAGIPVPQLDVEF